MGELSHPVAVTHMCDAASGIARIGASMKIRLLIAGVVAVATTLGLTVGTAGAAVNQDVIMLTCGGVTEQVVGQGNGQFTPARLVAGTKVYIPLAFGEFSGTVYDQADNVVDQFTDPSTFLKGKKGTGVQISVSCTYTVTSVSDGSDPEFPLGYTFVGAGQVTVFTTPRAQK